MDPTKPVEITESEEQFIVLMRDFPRLFDSETNIETRVVWNRQEQRWELKIGGFYKHTTVTLFHQPGQDVAVRGFTYHEYEVVGRYGSLGIVRDFNGLVALNAQEWRTYDERNRGYDATSGWPIDQGWLPFLLELGHVKQRVETKTTYLPA